MGCLAGLGALWQTQRHRQRRIPGQAVEEVADADQESPAMPQETVPSSSHDTPGGSSSGIHIEESGKTGEERQQEKENFDWEKWNQRQQALIEELNRINRILREVEAIRQARNEEAERRARFTAYNIRNDPEVVSTLYTQLALAEPEELQVFPPSEPRFWEQTAGQWTWANCKVYIHACLLSSTELVVGQVERCILGSPEASYGISLVTQAQITWLLPC